MSEALDEFARIARFFAPLAAPEGAGLRDDAAFFDPPPGDRLVVTADAIVESVHYLADDPPDLVARKLLRVNLSDLAAKGARPLGYLLTLSLPARCDEDWLAAFAAGLAADQREFGIGLFGGDSTAMPGLAALSATAIGAVAPGAEIRRDGARPGDTVWVSGTLGDAALGLRALAGKLGAIDAADREALADRYRLPRPRLGLGAALAGRVHAGLDVSDGLVADLGHICSASSVGATIELARLPLSAPARRALAGDPALVALVLGGGDDYELLFAAPETAAAAIGEAAAAAGVPVTAIGRIEEGGGVRVVDENGKEIPVALAGYRHF